MIYGSWKNITTDCMTPPSTSLPACEELQGLRSTYLKVRCGRRGQVHLMEPLQSFGIALTAAAGHSSCSQTSYTLPTHTHTHTHTHTAVSAMCLLNVFSCNVFRTETSCLLQSRPQMEIWRLTAGGSNTTLQTFVLLK